MGFERGKVPLFFFKWGLKGLLYFVCAGGRSPFIFYFLFQVHRIKAFTAGVQGGGSPLTSLFWRSA
jgi:hypothetical protein